MNFKIILLTLFLTLVVDTSSCSLALDQTDDDSQVEARDLVQRNIFFGEESFPINDPRVYQYGTVHLDGPSGGMLYRFGSTSDALEWIIEQHNLGKIDISGEEYLPLQFLEENPGWWNIDQVDLAEYYMFFEDLSTGGNRQLIVVFDQSTSTIYIVEHFSDMPGV